MKKENLAIEINNIFKKFGDLEVLKGISIKIKKGITTSILGPSGSGKTTLLRCINCLDKPDVGDIFIFGEKIGLDNFYKQSNLSRIRLKMAMVFQNFNLWPHLTVLGNIIESPVHVKKIPRKVAIEKALDLLEKFGIKDKKDDYPAVLSGGQKQRVAIARALSIEPEIILFDEPTSALDPLLVDDIVKIIKSLSQEGYTMIVVTHEIEFARKISDEVIFMENGIVLENTSSNLFFNSPKSKIIQEFISSIK